MIRVFFRMFSVAFRTVLVACAAYVYVGALQPYLERRVGTLTSGNPPIFRALQHKFETFFDFSQIPG